MQGRAVRRETIGECEIGDWVMMMDCPEWPGASSPRVWRGPDEQEYHFAFTEVDTMGDGEVVGTDFVWMRYDPSGPCPPGPRISGFKTVDPVKDPADWWKSE